MDGLCEEHGAKGLMMEEMRDRGVWRISIWAADPGQSRMELAG